MRDWLGAGQGRAQRGQVGIPIRMPHRGDAVLGTTCCRTHGPVRATPTWGPTQEPHLCLPAAFTRPRHGPAGVRVQLESTFRCLVCTPPGRERPCRVESPASLVA